MIRLKNVEKAIPIASGQVYVLRKIDLEVREGDFLTVMGPSGAGKSTLLAILGMLDAGWTGEYALDGHPVHALPPKKRAELNKKYVGFVFLNREGTTIVQVTHSEANAQYGNRILHLRDGWIDREERPQ